MTKWINKSLDIRKIIQQKKGHDVGITIENVVEVFLPGQVPTPLIYIIALLAYNRANSNYNIYIYIYRAKSKIISNHTMGKDIIYFALLLAPYLRVSYATLIIAQP